MDIVAISDLHGHFIEIPTCDLLLIAGDIVPLDVQQNLYASLNWLDYIFSKWIIDCPCKQVIAVWGNHDFVGMEATKEQLEAAIYKPTKYKIQFLDGQVCNVINNDDVIKIWGSPWCRTFYNWAFMLPENQLDDKYKSMPKGCDIVLTHDAPYIGDIGMITQGLNKGSKVGNKTLAKYIKDRQPTYAISGHIHSSPHELKAYKGCPTKLATVSIVDEDYQVVYEPLKFTI